MQEPADCLFLVQPVPGGKAQGIDTAQLPVVQSRITDSMAATTGGSAELRSVSKSAFVSLMTMRVAPKFEKLEALVLGGAEKLAAITFVMARRQFLPHASSRRRANCEVIE
jgi:hypothetical protein